MKTSKSALNYSDESDSKQKSVMTLEGTIRQYSVKIVSNKRITVIMQVFVNRLSETVPVEINGTVYEVCTKLNAIPVAGKLIANHLRDASCNIFNENGMFRFISLCGYDYRNNGKHQAV